MSERRSARGVFGAAVVLVRPAQERDADAAPLPTRHLGWARAVIALTGVGAAATLAWSLGIEPGQAMFYPATLLVALVYAVGLVVAGRIAGTRSRWRVEPRQAWMALGAGVALAVVFIAGAFLVRFVPALRDPVVHLLDHARRGSLPLVALTTLVNGVAEEAFYRGGLWRVLPARHRVVWTTVAYTAVTAVAGIPLLALAAAMLGVVVAVLRRRSGSLAAPIITHLTWSMLMLFVLPHVVR